MKVLDGIQALREWQSTVTPLSAPRTLGLVPTMGALHEGHLALVRRARAECDLVCVSVFVNPTQFGPGEDLASYPRDRARDSELAAEVGADAVWFARAEEVYPAGFATRIELPSLANRLCGIERPHHFPGVALIVLKLLHLFRPTHAYFGEKDYQQSVLVTRMVRDLDLDLAIVTCPIVREESGLARSSRNVGLSEAGRMAAGTLSAGLFRAQMAYAEGVVDAAALIGEVVAEIGDQKVALEFIELVDRETLEPLETVDPALGARLLIAGRVEKVRLIDNVPLGGPEA